MSILLLALLLIVLVALGLLMTAKPVREMFEDAPSQQPPAISPALANLISTPDLTPMSKQVNVIGRDSDLQNSTDVWSFVPNSRGNISAARTLRSDVVNSLDICKANSAADPGCNIFSFDNGICMLQSSANPEKEQMIPSQNSKGIWIRKGSNPNPNPKPNPNPNPTPDPNSTFAHVPLTEGSVSSAPVLRYDVVNSLDICKANCGTDTQCNEFSYANGVCMLQNSANPGQDPLVPHAGSMGVWIRNAGPSPAPGPKPQPHPQPKPHPQPGPDPSCNCEQCPDMSQYIRLDEIPCWNCSLP